MDTRNTFLALAAFVAVASSCKKDRSGGVPLTPVNISININLPEYVDLSVPGGWLYLTGGSQGLIVYRYSQDVFYVMDRHCTYNPTDLCRVVVDADGLFAADTACCHSTFLLVNNGDVVEGPASIHLTRYNSTFNGTTLHIYN